MKNLKWPFQKNEKMITAISPTCAGMEWSIVRLHDQGMDVVEQSSISLSEAQEEAPTAEEAPAEEAAPEAEAPAADDAETDSQD